MKPTETLIVPAADAVKHLPRTGWISGQKPPVRVGFYERNHEIRNYVSIPDYFDGECWYPGLVTGTVGKKPSLFQGDLQWRGITRGRGRPRKSA